MNSTETILINSREICVKLMYRGDLNYYWREYNIEFPDFLCNLCDDAMYLKDTKEVTKIIKNFLIDKEMQNINYVYLESDYIGDNNKHIQIMAGCYGNKQIFRKLKIDEI